MTIKIYSYAWPIKPCSNLLNMCGFSSSMISLNHHSTIMFKACQDCESGIFIKDIGLVDFWHPLCFIFKTMYLEIRINPKGFFHVEFLIRPLWETYSFRIYHLIYFLFSGRTMLTFERIKF